MEKITVTYLMGIETDEIGERAETCITLGVSNEFADSILSNNKNHKAVIWLNEIIRNLAHLQGYNLICIESIERR